MNVELWIVLLRDDQQILRQRQLPLTKNRVGIGQQFLRLAAAGVGDVALAADGQQQRMHARRVDGMHRVHARDDSRNDRPGDFVNDLAERRVFLRRAADDGERPDGASAMRDRLDVEHRKIVRQAVVAQMIAKRSFGRSFCGSTVPLMQKSASA